MLLDVLPDSFDVVSVLISDCNVVLIRKLEFDVFLLHIVQFSFVGSGLEVTTEDVIAIVVVVVLDDSTVAENLIVRAFVT